MSSDFKLYVVSSPKNPIFGGSSTVPYKFVLNIKHTKEDFDLKNFFSTNQIELFCHSISPNHKKLKISFEKRTMFWFNKENNSYVIEVCLGFRSTTRGNPQPLYFSLYRKTDHGFNFIASSNIEVEIISKRTLNNYTPIKKTASKRKQTTLFEKILKGCVGLSDETDEVSPDLEKKIAQIYRLIKECSDAIVV